MRCLTASILALLALTPPLGADEVPESELLTTILRSDPRLAPVVENAAEHRLQVVLGLVEDGPDGRPRLVQPGFRAGAEYFYPASTVKMFAAVLAFQELADLRRETGHPIDLHTPLVFHPPFPGDTLSDQDPSNLEGGRITVAHEVRKLFLVSDNVAFNRLFELIGRDEMNARLHRAGLASARIVHRLDRFLDPEAQRRLPRIDFAGDGFTHTIPERTSEEAPLPPDVPGLDVGRRHVVGEVTLDGPMDFRPKNSITLADLQRGLALTLRPDVDSGGHAFELTNGERAFLEEAMHQLPRESKNPVYDPEEYPDHYVKFFLPGLERVVPKEKLRVYNKVGLAYGFLTDNAWIVDTGSGRGFFLAATVYVNPNGVVNDSDYAYEEVGEPFLADLAETVARALRR